MSGDDHIDRFFLMDAEGVHAGEIHRTESGAVAAAEAHPGRGAATQLLPQRHGRQGGVDAGRLRRLATGRMSIRAKG